MILSHSVEDIRDTKRAYWAEIVKNEGVQAFPGFRELLQIFKKEGYTIALASNRNEKPVRLVLDTLAVTTLFDFIVGGQYEERRQKPFPDLYIHAAEELGLDPAECVVLEDTEIGVIAAKDAGMKVIAVPNVYTEDHDFSRADRKVKSLLDINLDLLDSL